MQRRLQMSAQQVRSIWTSAGWPGDTTRVSAALDRRACVELTTSTVPAGRFSGRIEHVPVGDLELSAGRRAAFFINLPLGSAGW
jgi:hypothetical protein